jgi:glutamate-1-semialdehyde 2,1-aminomutase
MTTIDCGRLHELYEPETAHFVNEYPHFAETYRRAKGSLLGGGPIHWVKKWAGPFPVFVKTAQGAHFTDVEQPRVY